MDNISVFGTEDSGFESWRGHMKKIFFLFFLGSLFLFPLISWAGEYDVETYNDLNANGRYDAGEPTSTAIAAYDGLVPCGKCVSVDSVVVLIAKPTDEAQCGVTEGTPTNIKYVHCQFCHFFVMLEGIVDFILFQLIPPIAVLMIVIGALMFIFGGSSPTTVMRGRSIMTSVAIGLVIIFAAWLLINTLLLVLGLSDFAINLGVGPGEWNKIPCLIQIPQ